MSSATIALRIKTQAAGELQIQLAALGLLVQRDQLAPDVAHVFERPRDPQGGGVLDFLLWQSVTSHPRALSAFLQGVSGAEFVRVEYI